MIKDLLQSRFTAKWWNEQAVEPEKLSQLLDTVYLAPSKNGRYTFTLYVLADSSAALEFKQWLYWENTWCLDTVRGKPGPGLKRFNGQVIAPVVLLWVGHDQSRETRDDIMVSATVAMCAAQELGLQTGFNGCLGETEITEKLGIADKKIVDVMSLGIGYASIDQETKRPVYDQQGVEVGFDLANVDPANRKVPTRQSQPSKDILIKLF
jgi:hypothetical protein